MAKPYWWQLQSPCEMLRSWLHSSSLKQMSILKLVLETVWPWCWNLPQHLAVLQKARADLHSCHEPFGFTPLTAACGLAGCSTETVRALLENRCNPNPQLMGAGHAPLHHAIFFSRGQPSPLQTVQLLLQMKADPNTPVEPSGDFASKAEAVLREERLNGKRFTSYSSKHFAINPGMTPLHAAAWVGDHDITRLLLDHGADLRASNRRGDSPDDLAIESGNLHLLPLLTIHFWQHLCSLIPSLS